MLRLILALLLISTAAGAVLHTGDWKLDPDPIVGAGFDRERLERLGREPVLAMVCDSTNAVVPGSTGSEGSLFAPLAELVERLELTGRRLAVELNLEIVPRSQYAETQLADGDRVEIVHAIGGG